jgi:hypothetical protein
MGKKRKIIKMFRYDLFSSSLLLANAMKNFSHTKVMSRDEKKGIIREPTSSFDGIYLSEVLSLGGKINLASFLFAYSPAYGFVPACRGIRNGEI